MPTSICTLNLTSRDRRLLPDLSSTRAHREDVSSPDAIPQDPSLILYVVGHAVQNGLVMPNGDILKEGALADIILTRRGPRPTLIVWDVCFAKSLLDISGRGDSWPSNFVHIFSCQEFERTWHTGPEGTNRQHTIFSSELLHAIRAAKSAESLSWSTIQANLRDQLSSIQVPEISTTGSLEPSTFQLESIV